MRAMESETSLMPNSCRFCSYFTGHESAHKADSPWLINEDYAALVSVGAFIPGWSLVCPTTHSLNLCTSYKDARFWDFATEVVDLCQSQYGDVAVFEHGACYTDSATSCGTAHAHLHVVPLDFALTKAVIDFDENRAWRKCSAVDISQIACGREYLFMSERFKGDRTEGYISTLNTGVSQFFRQVIANHLGLMSKYDYREYPHHEISDTSADVLRRAAILKRLRAA